MKWYYLITLALTSHLYASDASNCSNTDITDKMPPKLKEQFKVPRDQGRLGWCFGFAASELLSVHLGEQVSALHVSMIRNSKIDHIPRRAAQFIIDLQRKDQGHDGVFESGTFLGTLKKIIKHGAICKEEDLPYHLNKDNKPSLIINVLEARKKLKKKDTCSNSSLEANTSLYPLISNVSEIEEKLHTQNLNTALLQVGEMNCKNKMLKVEPFEIKRIKSGDFISINSALDLGKPIAVKYDVNHVVNKSGSHYSVITGRRWNEATKQCEYKIKNSWGKRCGKYKKEIECVEAEGSFWVSSPKLKKLAQDLRYIP